MDYELTPDEPLHSGVRRVAYEQIDAALGGLGDPQADGVEETVHDVRKRCKKLRGLVRLVRPALGDEYQQANKLFRDAARQLSALRDDQALLETFDDLVAAHADHLPDGGLGALRATLAARAEAAGAAAHADDGRLRRATDLLQRARERVESWPVGDDPAPLEGGLAKTYRRGRRALDATAACPTDEELHELRKRAKYTWYHVRLLTPAAPSVLDPLASRLHDLSDALGDDHDLAVLDRTAGRPTRGRGPTSTAPSSRPPRRWCAPGALTCSGVRGRSRCGCTSNPPRPSPAASSVTGTSASRTARSCPQVRSAIWSTPPTPSQELSHEDLYTRARSSRPRRTLADGPRRARRHGPCRRRRVGMSAVRVIERERTFLVRRVPGELGEPTPIRQGYVALDGDRSLRVAREGVGADPDREGWQRADPHRGRARPGP